MLWNVTNLMQIHKRSTWVKQHKLRKMKFQQCASFHRNIALQIIKLIFSLLKINEQLLHTIRNELTHDWCNLHVGICHSHIFVLQDSHSWCKSQFLQARTLPTSLSLVKGNTWWDLPGVILYHSMRTILTVCAQCPGESILPSPETSRKLTCLF